MENNTNLVRVRRTELKYLQSFSDCVFWAEYRPQCGKVFPPNFMGENSQYRGDKIIRKNWLIKAFSNEIKSRTFSHLWPGFYLFWLTKRNTTHKIPGTSTVYWVATRRNFGWFRTFIIPRPYYDSSHWNYFRNIARNDRWFAHLHIQNGDSKRIWILTYSWTDNFPG